MSESLLIERKGAVGWIALNKPAKLNALDEEMLAGVQNAIDAWEADREVVAICLRSSLERAFCVGADIERLGTMTPETMQDWERFGGRVLDRLQDSRLISVASISGYAFGGGLTLALACDFRICSDKAQFSQPEIGLGWIPGWSGVSRLVRTVGVSRAKELSMFGERWDAAKADAAGLVNRVVPAADLVQETQRFVETLAAQSPNALRTIKSIADTALPLPGASQKELDALANAALLTDERGQQSIREFLARSKK
jgi:enoyl-CoA hydratase/carnithine racemase